MSESKLGLIFCVCTGKCSGFAKMDIRDFINIFRKNEKLQYAMIHPMLCDEDGKISGGVSKKRLEIHRRGMRAHNAEKTVQRSLRKSRMNLDIDHIPLDVRNMITEEAVALVEKTIDEHTQ